MDAIDITDSTFSLNVPENLIVGKDDNTTMLIYALVFLVGLVGMLAYTFYFNKSKHVSFQDDCQGGFCTMEKCAPR